MPALGPKAVPVFTLQIALALEPKVLEGMCLLFLRAPWLCRDTYLSESSHLGWLVFVDTNLNVPGKRE